MASLFLVLSPPTHFPHGTSRPRPRPHRREAAAAGAFVALVLRYQELKAHRNGGGRVGQGERNAAGGAPSVAAAPPPPEERTSSVV